MCWGSPSCSTQGRLGAGELLAVLGMELVPAAGQWVGMTEGPAGPERLKSGKSETNDKQTVTANTEQILFLMSSVKWPSRSQFILAELSCWGGADVQRGFETAHLRERRKTCPEIHLLSPGTDLCVPLWFASFQLQTLICSPSPGSIQGEIKASAGF